jgi:hypothetical protein
MSHAKIGKRRSHRLSLGVYSLSAIGMIHSAVRWNMVTWLATSESGAIICTPVEPVPMTPIRFPSSFTS